METTLLSGLELQKWRSKFIYEMVRESGFEPYMGDDETNIIHVVNDLNTDGFTIRVPLLGKLTSEGVSGNQRLSGNEEKMNQFYQDISWAPYRNAIEISEFERDKAAVDLLAAARPRLKTWAAEKIKHQIIDCFHTMSNGDLYQNASATNRNTWLTNNSDRVLFGKVVANHSSGVMATALGNIDATEDKLTTDMITLARQRARLASPIIHPWKSEEGREYYVLWAHPFCFRDLKKDSAMVQANRDARPREVANNPIFQDGDLLWDGVIIKENVDFYSGRNPGTINASTHLAGAGASTIDVGVNFLCGRQAIAYVNKEMPKPIAKKEDDYGFFDGVGIKFKNGMAKLRWNNNSAFTNKDVGICTVYAAATPNA